eukprot:NODE_3340_length_986_cov_21.479627_g3194_i0.p1 GENE.NODE_3340_length_986_cov_21.479627_g3194_i0~~NODE_3340_length_986_cov_21.479627_g3194_i0.p1  ORF type:complete len:283 (-),score=76.16 NODE_3340_length_986_cov_21.479627_g3194_i0:138-938(-)
MTDSPYSHPPIPLGEPQQLEGGYCPQLPSEPVLHVTVQLPSELHFLPLPLQQKLQLQLEEQMRHNANLPAPAQAELLARLQQSMKKMTLDNLPPKLQAYALQQQRRQAEPQQPTSAPSPAFDTPGFIDPSANDANPPSLQDMYSNRDLSSMCNEYPTSPRDAPFSDSSKPTTEPTRRPAKPTSNPSSPLKKSKKKPPKRLPEKGKYYDETYDYEGMTSPVGDDLSPYRVLLSQMRVCHKVIEGLTKREKQLLQENAELKRQLAALN